MGCSNSSAAPAESDPTSPTSSGASGGPTSPSSRTSTSSANGLRRSSSKEKLCGEDAFLEKFIMDSVNIKDELVDGEAKLKLCVKENLFSWSFKRFVVKKEDGSDFLTARMGPKPDNKGENPMQKTPSQDRMVIEDMEGKPIAVCVNKVLDQECFFVYAFQPRKKEGNKDQLPSGEASYEGGMPLYSWAQVVEDQSTTPSSFTLNMATGKDVYQSALYRAERPGMFATSKLLVKKRDRGACYIDQGGGFDFPSENCHSVAVAAGVDPVLMVCLTAITDQIQNSAEKALPYTSYASEASCKDYKGYTSEASNKGYTSEDARKSSKEKAKRPEMQLISSEQFCDVFAKDARNIADELINETANLKLCVKEKLFKEFESNSVVKRENGTKTGRAMMTVRKQESASRDRMVIEDMEGSPIAVLVNKAASLAADSELCFYVYAFNRRVHGQACADERFENRKLYCWAQIVEDFETSPSSYDINLATGHDEYLNPMYKAEKHTYQPTMYDAPRMKLLVKKRDKGACYMDRSEFTFPCTNCHAVTVAAGLDPVLMVCLAAVRDELNDSDYRRIHAQQIEGNERRGLEKREEAARSRRTSISSIGEQVPVLLRRPSKEFNRQESPPVAASAV